MEQLALKYRPVIFDDLVGQRAVHVFLRQMVATDAVPSALLFHGPRGTGKTTTARITAAALNCDNRPGPCGHCPSCKGIADGTSLDVVEIDAASNGLVDDIRALRQQVLHSVGGNWRIVILDEAHSMSQAAFNALLKTLEEPPPRTVFILATTEPGKIPHTVASRCMSFLFTRVSVADIAARLRHITAAEHITADPALIDYIAERADGALRDAVMTLDQMHRAGISTLEQYADLTGETDIGPVIVEAIASGNIATVYATTADVYTRIGDPDAIADTVITTLRDILILHAGGTLTASGPALDARTRLADQLDPVAVHAACGVLWDHKVRVRATDNPRVTLDLALAVLTGKLRPATPAANPAPTRTLSLAEMTAMHR